MAQRTRWTHTRSDHPVSQKTNQTSHRGFYEIHYLPEASSMREAKTLVEKVWERHVVQRAEGEQPTFAVPVAATSAGDMARRITRHTMPPTASRYSPPPPSRP